METSNCQRGVVKGFKLYFPLRNHHLKRYFLLFSTFWLFYHVSNGNCTGCFLSSKWPEFAKNPKKTSSTSSIRISKLTSSAPHEEWVQKFETAVEDVWGNFWFFMQSVQRKKKPECCIKYNNARFTLHSHSFSCKCDWFRDADGDPAVIALNIFSSCWVDGLGILSKRHAMQSW